jgi:tRNA-2-methylthio-N6-dimethylallyladenosine synthase
MKLFIKTFGCQMNFADSDEISDHFQRRGFELAPDEQSADAIVVNTCTVRDLAEHKAVSFVGHLRKWRESNPDGFIVVTGCAAERIKADIKRRFPYVDLVVGAKDIENFPHELDAFLRCRQFSLDALVPNQIAPSTTNQVSRFVTIMRGCNYNCTYCIVPSVRGREVYLPAQSVLNEIRTRVDEGAKEVWLLGQTVNSYRPPRPPYAGYDFSDLLRDVNQVEGLRRIRFMSPHPYYLTPKLIETMANCEKVCEHIHLPVQSGSNKILSKMKRNYTRESFLNSLEILRKRIPKISVTSDVVVGFPGETKADFEQTLSLVKEAQFDSAYCFKYSARPGTPAAQWNETASLMVKNERVNRVLEITEVQGIKRVESLIGSTQEVLLDEIPKKGVFRGRTRSSFRARVEAPDLKLGQSVSVQVVGHHLRELHATPLKVTVGAGFIPPENG